MQICVCNYLQIIVKTTKDVYQFLCSFNKAGLCLVNNDLRRFMLFYDIDADELLRAECSRSFCNCFRRFI